MCAVAGKPELSHALAGGADTASRIGAGSATVSRASMPAVLVPIGPIFFGNARRRCLGEGSVNGGFAARLLGALLLEHSKTNLQNGTHVLSGSG